MEQRRWERKSLERSGFKEWSQWNRGFGHGYATKKRMRWMFVALRFERRVLNSDASGTPGHAKLIIGAIRLRSCPASNRGCSNSLQQEKHTHIHKHHADSGRPTHRNIDTIEALAHAFGYMQTRLPIFSVRAAFSEKMPTHGP